MELPNTTVLIRIRGRGKIQAGSAPYSGLTLSLGLHINRAQGRQRSNFYYKKREVVLNSFYPKKLNVSSSHKSLHALTIQLPKGDPAHAEQLLQNLHQFNVNVPKMRRNLFLSPLQKAQ